MEMKSSNPRIMLHIIMPNQISGPNTASRLIANSSLTRKYRFEFLIQNRLAGGKISLSLIRDLMRQIKDFDPDIVHLNGLQSSGFHAVVAARLCGYNKILMAIRGTSVDAINLKPVKRYIFGKIIEPLTLMMSHTVYSVCEAMAKREFVKKYSKRPIGFIHNSAPLVEDIPLQTIKLREVHNIDEHALVVAIVGRVVYDKGVSFVAEAIKSFHGSNLVFVFIGTGPYIENISFLLKSEIEDRKVLLLGQQDKVLSILKECNIFLFATLHENLSNALLEACSLGLSIIATNVGGNPEVIKDHYNGILIPPRNSLSIVEALNYLVTNPEERERLSTNAKITIKNEFSQCQLLKKLDQVYTNILHSE